MIIKIYIFHRYILIIYKKKHEQKIRTKKHEKKNKNHFSKVIFC